MPSESIRPGYAFKADTASATYSDNRIELRGAITTLKICNDNGAAIALEFVLNRAEDSTEIDGIVPAGKELNLSDIDQGISSIAVRGNGAAYRLWAYY